MSVFNKDKTYDDTKLPYYYNNRDTLGQNDPLAHQYLQKSNYNGLNIGTNGYNNGVSNLSMQQQASRVQSLSAQTMQQSQTRGFNDSSIFSSGIGGVKPIANPQQGTMLGLYAQQQPSSAIIQQQQQSQRNNPSSLSLLNNNISNSSFDNSNFPMLSASSSNTIGGLSGSSLGSSQLQQQHSHTISRGSNIIGASSTQHNTNNNAFGSSSLLSLTNNSNNARSSLTHGEDDFPALSGSSPSTKSSTGGTDALSTDRMVHNAFMTRDIALVNNSSGITTITDSVSSQGGGGSLIGAQTTDNNGSLSPGSANQFGSIGSSLLQSSNGTLDPISNNLLNSNTLTGTNHSKEFKFGLTGLLDIIRISDKNVNALALGTDLTTFGLNLNSADTLYPTFSSPFTDHVLTPDPDYHTPSCYMMHPPSLKAEHLSKFQIETLFYMFYSMPKDLLQAYSAQELYRRDWRYHGELKLWLKPRAPLELMQSHPSVQFVYFDSHTWETRLFTATSGRENITLGLLSEEDIRVPQAGSSS